MRRSLTQKQRDTLERIEVVRDLQVCKLREVIATYDHMAGLKPSEWVSEHTLTGTHHLHRNVIRALVAKGYLESRPSDGWGPEVRVVA